MKKTENAAQWCQCQCWGLSREMTRAKKQKMLLSRVNVDVVNKKASRTAEKLKTKSNKQKQKMLLSGVDVDFGDKSIMDS